MSLTGDAGGLYRDEYHKSRMNGEKVEGKFVAIDWKWDGEVKNFRHDGAWEWQKPVPSFGPDDDFKWWNSNGKQAEDKHLSGTGGRTTTAASREHFPSHTIMRKPYSRCRC